MIILSRSRSGSITYQIKNELLSKCRFGESRDEAKKNGTACKYIYSYGSLNTYMKQLNYMVKWARTNDIKLKNLEDIKIHGDEWLQFCVDSKFSAWTIAVRRSALAKLLNVPYSYFKTQIPPRKRCDIKRSRNNRNDSHFSESKNREQIIFCKCTGLRLSELKMIRGNDLFLENGTPYLNVTKGTKGGRSRTIKIYGSPEELKLCVELAKQAGDEKIFKHVKESANTHGYRAQFARRVYETEAAKIDQMKLTRKDLYYCRGDKKGTVYIRQALLITSQMLGHNRINVVPINYLY